MSFVVFNIVLLSYPAFGSLVFGTFILQSLIHIHEYIFITFQILMS